MTFCAINLSFCYFVVFDILDIFNCKFELISNLEEKSSNKINFVCKPNAISIFSNFHLKSKFILSHKLVSSKKKRFLAAFILILFRCACAKSGFSGFMRMRIIWGAKVPKSRVMRIRYKGDSGGMRMTLSGYGRVGRVSQF